jgi:hypothetical protein
MNEPNKPENNEQKPTELPMFEYVALHIMCALLQSDSDMATDTAAALAVEGAVDMSNALNKHYTKLEKAANES